MILHYMQCLRLNLRTVIIAKLKSDTLPYVIPQDSPARCIQPLDILVAPAPDIRIFLDKQDSLAPICNIVALDYMTCLRA